MPSTGAYRGCAKCQGHQLKGGRARCDCGQQGYPGPQPRLKLHRYREGAQKEGPRQGRALARLAPGPPGVPSPRSSPLPRSESSEAHRTSEGSDRPNWPECRCPPRPRCGDSGWSPWCASLRASRRGGGDGCGVLTRTWPRPGRTDAHPPPPPWHLSTAPAPGRRGLGRLYHVLHRPISTKGYGSEYSLRYDT